MDVSLEVGLTVNILSMVSENSRPLGLEGNIILSTKVIVRTWKQVIKHKGD